MNERMYDCSSQRKGKDKPPANVYAQRDAFGKQGGLECRTAVFGFGFKNPKQSLRLWSLVLRIDR